MILFTFLDSMTENQRNASFGCYARFPPVFLPGKIPAAGPENGKFRTGKRKAGGNRQFNIIRQAGKPAFSGPEKKLKQSQLFRTGNNIFATYNRCEKGE